jgi:hypothetical protein
MLSGVTSIAGDQKDIGFLLPCLILKKGKRNDPTRMALLLGLGGIIIGSTKTFYLLDGDEEIAEYDQNGNVLRRYIAGPAIDDRIAMIEGSSTSPVTPSPEI